MCVKEKIEAGNGVISILVKLLKSSVPLSSHSSITVLNIFQLRTCRISAEVVSNEALTYTFSDYLSRYWILELLTEVVMILD